MSTTSSQITVVAALVLAAGIAGTDVAEAHVSVTTGPVAANATSKITFSVGHGCEHFDTVRVRVVIPSTISSVRALRSDFGKPTFERDANDNVIAVTWSKPESERLDSDYGYYDLTIRARVADVPFTKISFSIYQTCIDGSGNEVTVAWDQPDESSGNPAGTLVVVPPRQSGWNRYVLGASTTIAEADVPTYFGDAAIVWRGSAAYSSNANTYALISATPGVTLLTGALNPGDELWVKY